ncbi:uncharacterized protein LOC143917797 isoform X2 [Arctopsyche grandis]
MVTGSDLRNDLYLICDICITRLRNAFLFRLQMEIAYETFQKHLISNSHLNKDLCISDEQVSLNNGADENYKTEHSDNYHSDANDEEFCMSSQNETSIDTTKFSDAKITPNTLINDHSDLVLQTNIIGNKVKPSKHNRKKQNEISNGNEIGKINSEHKNRMLCKAGRFSDINTHGKLIVDTKQFNINSTDLTCKICNETFLWNRTLKKHMSVHFPNHICHVCGKAFVFKKGFLFHVNSHSDKSMKTCKICKKSYEGLGKLQLHMRSHSDLHLHRCPQCPERFTTFLMKVKHLIDIHNDEPNKYKCKLCPKRFLMAGYLARHIRKDHLQERKIECSECHERFYSTSELKGHMLKHTGVKSFHCDKCTKSYARRKTLKEHMKIHNNIKNYVCMICSRAFTQKCTLKGHMKVHGKIKDTSQEIDKT